MANNVYQIFVKNIRLKWPKTFYCCETWTKNLQIVIVDKMYLLLKFRLPKISSKWYFFMTWKCNFSLKTKFYTKIGFAEIYVKSVNQECLPKICEMLPLKLKKFIHEKIFAWSHKLWHIQKSRELLFQNFFEQIVRKVTTTLRLHCQHLEILSFLRFCVCSQLPTQYDCCQINFLLVLLSICIKICCILEKTHRRLKYPLLGRKLKLNYIALAQIYDFWSLAVYFL